MRRVGSRSPPSSSRGTFPLPPPTPESHLAIEARSPTPAQRRRLLAAARGARVRAYAPYSKFRVGSAVLDGRGRVFAGCNVENGSSPSSLCAEQAAVAAAVAGGARSVAAVLILTGAPAPMAPCGRCLQVLAEFGPGMAVLLATASGRLEESTLPALLPRPFRR